MNDVFPYENIVELYYVWTRSHEWPTGGDRRTTTRLYEKRFSKGNEYERTRKTIYEMVQSFKCNRLYLTVEKYRGSNNIHLVEVNGSSRRITFEARSKIVKYILSIWLSAFFSIGLPLIVIPFSETKDSSRVENRWKFVRASQWKIRFS